MRIIAFVPSVHDTSPGQRFRIEQWAPKLRDFGVEIQCAPFESSRLHEVLYTPGNTATKSILIAEALLRRVVTMCRLSDFDAAYVFREAALLGPAVFERWMQVVQVPIIFDFDDAVFLRYRSPSNGCLSALKCAGKTRTICRIASHVMAGNPHLAAYARSVNRNVSIVPTTIDTDIYKPRSRPELDRPLTIGWTGSYSTIQHLDTIREALSILATREHFRLRVIGTKFYDLPGVEVEAMPWRAEREIDDLMAIDIGIMPLPDDDWSRGKCGLKALQCMALGIPTICSPVGVNTDIIRDGENGYLAACTAEWVAKLTQLLHSATLRDRIGAESRRTVEATYSTRVQVPYVYEIFKSVVQGSVRKRMTVKLGGTPETPDRIINRGGCNG